MLPKSGSFLCPRPVNTERALSFTGVDRGIGGGAGVNLGGGFLPGVIGSVVAILRCLCRSGFALGVVDTARAVYD